MKLKSKKKMPNSMFWLFSSVVHVLNKKISKNKIPAPQKIDAIFNLLTIKCLVKGEMRDMCEDPRSNKGIGYF